MQFQETDQSDKDEDMDSEESDEEWQDSLYRDKPD